MYFLSLIQGADADQTLALRSLWGSVTFDLSHS